MNGRTVIVGGALIFLGLGAANGGVVRGPDGKIVPGSTVERSASLGGEQAGKALDRTAEAVGRGAGSAFSESDIAKAAAIGAAAYGAAKAKAKLGDRYSICWKRKSCDGTPIPEPEVIGRDDLQIAPPILIG